MDKGKKNQNTWKEMFDHIHFKKRLIYICLIVLGVIFILLFCDNNESPMLIALCNIGAGFISAVVLAGFLDIHNGREREEQNKIIRADVLNNLSECCKALIEELVSVYLKRRSLFFGNKYPLNLLELEFDTLWEELETIESKCRENIKPITDNERTRNILDPNSINLALHTLCRELDRTKNSIIPFEAAGYFSHDEVTCLTNARIALKNVFISEKKIEMESIQKGFSILTQIPEISAITKEKIYYNHIDAFITHNGYLETGVTEKQMDVANAIKYETRKKDELVLKTGEGSLFDYHDGIIE